MSRVLSLGAPVDAQTRLAEPTRAFTFSSLQRIESLSMQWPGRDGLPAGIWRCGDPLVGCVRPPDLFKRAVRAQRGDGGASERDQVAAASDAKNYTGEIQGYADPTGDFDKNLRLSQDRAEPWCST